MFANGFGWPHLLIIVALLVLLFGAKRLPDAARSVGRSMRIFKAETKSMRDDDAGEAGHEDHVPPVQQQLPPVQPQVAKPAAEEHAHNDQQR